MPISVNQLADQVDALSLPGFSCEMLETQVSADRLANHFDELSLLESFCEMLGTQISAEWLAHPADELSFLGFFWRRVPRQEILQTGTLRPETSVDRLSAKTSPAC